jgi:50S ribosomal subunit-associated GTPase HflX
MPNTKPGSGESSLEQHVRKVLAQISALKDRLRAQEQARQSGSKDNVEVEREDDRSRRIDCAYLPA